MLSPEHIAHQTNKIQIQLVAVLGLIALFTHNQLFWIAALFVSNDGSSGLPVAGNINGKVSAYHCTARTSPDNSTL